jgi:WD40 repeat protein
LRALLAGAAVLLVAALGAGGFAALQGQRAADEARNATEQRQVADQQRALAEQAARNAQSRSLIASALTALDRDPSLAKLLAIEAITVADKPTSQSTSALHQVLAADPIIGRYQYPQESYRGELWTDLDPTGQLLVASGGGGHPTSHLEVADARSGRVLWSYPTGAAGGTSGYIGPSWFSADGTQVIAGLYWGPPMTRDGEEPPSSIAAALGAMVWDAHTGEFVRRIDLGPCGGQVTGVSATRLLVWTPVPDPDGGGCTWLIPGVFGAGSLTVEVVDLVTEEPTVLSRQATWVAGGTLSGDGRFAGFDLPEPGACGKDCFTSVVIDLDNGNKEVFRLERDPNYHPTSTQQGLDTGGGPAATRLNYDGSLLLYGDDPTLVYDIAAGSARPIAREPGPGGGSLWAEFDRSGTVYEASPDDGTLRRWDPRTGQLIASWPAVGRSRPSVAIDGRIVLVSDGASPRAVLLDSGVRGELGEVRTIPVGNVPRGSLRSTALSPDRSLRATGGSDGVLRVWDTQSGELTQQMGFAGSLVAEVTFKDDRHLAVTLQTGEVLTMIIDPQELVDAVRASLTRSFTPGECATYGIDPCPTLEQIRAP